VKPYEGEEPYIFFSYCRQNGEIVYPLVEKMASAGFRIWYDDGIHPGDDWPEVIAKHIDGCAACVAAVSEEFAGSHNCKNEMNYVIGKGMTFVPILMADFPMTPGMQYMLGGSQYIKKYEFSDDEAFYQRILTANSLQKCRGTESFLTDVDPQREERQRQAEAERQRQAEAERQRQAEEERQRQAEEERQRREEEERQRQAEEERQRREEEERQRQAEEERQRREEEERQRRVEVECQRQAEEERKRQAEEDLTVLEEPTIWENQDERTVYDSDVQEKRMSRNAVLVHLSQGRIFPINKPMVKIGRGDNCDLILKKPTVGTLHAVIGQNTGKYFLRDEDSLNGTWLNGSQVNGLEPVFLAESAHINISGEEIIFLQGAAADELLTSKQCAMLSCMETEETKFLGKTEVILGRSYAWPGGTFSDMRASRLHGTICVADDGQYVFSASDKETTNGTYLNGKYLAPGEKIVLRDNDEIRIGHVYHIQFRCVEMEIGEPI
jgi:pSer/pThr/pTyr-binding forkhead associated (FHA) protein